MIRLRRSLPALFVLLPFTSALAATTESWSVMLNDHVIGSLVATREGRDVEVQWRIDDNGRGPRIRERLVLDDQDRVIAHRIDGFAWYGPPVRVRYSWRSGVARWQTLSDAGQMNSATPPFYEDPDGSLWSSTLAFRQALGTPDHSVPVAPSGAMRLSRLRELPVGSGDRAVAVTAYSVTGLDMQPGFVLLDAQNQLFAQVNSGYVTVRKGYEGEFTTLSALGQSLERQTLAQLTRDHRRHYESPIYLRDVRVFDSIKGGLSAPTTVAVFRGRITGLHASIPQDGAAVIVDGAGQTLVPGLFDTHVHDDPWQGPLQIAAGVTTVRDMGNENETLLSLERLISSGELIGPRIVKAGFIEGKSPYASSNGRTATTLDDALQAAHWYADRGYRQIKIYNSMRPEWVSPLAAEAHRLGMQVSGHVPAFMTSMQAIRDGYDEVNHINQLVLPLVIGPDEDTRTLFRFTALGERFAGVDLRGEPAQQLLQLLKERGTTIEPTLAIFQQMFLSWPGTTPPNDAGWLDHAPAAVQRERRMPFIDIKPGQRATYAASWQKLLVFVKQLSDAGVPLLAGTDDMAGFMLHSELEVLALAGIPPARVLQIATIDAARHLGIDRQVGSIERGKLVELLLVEGDPTTDISAIRRVKLVMQGENVWVPAELHEAVGVKPFAQPPVITVRKD